MEFVSALIGLVIGVFLTIFTEIIKRSSQRKIVASKLLSESIIHFRDLLESDSFGTVSAAQKIYSNDDLRASKQKLDKYLQDFTARMKADKHIMEEFINKVKSDKVLMDKQLYLISIEEERYKNDTFLMTKQEISILPAYVQSVVSEMIENYFGAFISYKYILIRARENENDLDIFINDFIEINRYLIKAHKDRDIIHRYAKKISNQSLLKSTLLELKF